MPDEAAELFRYQGFGGWFNLYNRWRNRHPKPPVKPPAVLSAFITAGGVKVANIMLTDQQTGEIVAVIIDAIGNPASLAAGVTWGWTSSAPAVATVAPDPADPTGLSAIVTPNPQAGNLGTTTITGMSSDGLTQATIDCQIVGSSAVSAKLTLTPIVPQAAAPAPVSTPVPASSATPTPASPVTSAAPAGAASPMAAKKSGPIA